jgi:hypothetical protein
VKAIQRARSSSSSLSFFLSSPLCVLAVLHTYSGIRNKLWRAARDAAEYFYGGLMIGCKKEQRKTQRKEEKPDRTCPFSHFLLNTLLCPG